MNHTETKQVLTTLNMAAAALRHAMAVSPLGDPLAKNTEIAESDARAAIALCEASLARVVEPVGRVGGDDVRRLIVWSPAVAAFDYPVGTLVYATPQEAAAQPNQVPKGFALVPIRATSAMEEVFSEEGWEWANVLAAAEAVTEEEYEQALDGAQPSQAVELSTDDVRTAGGIVHSNGNVFFTNIAKLNAAINAKVST